MKTFKKERKIPFDPVVKITLLFFHFIGFSVWYGGVVINMDDISLFRAITGISGVLLLAREVYKDRIIWLVGTEGLLTILKVALLIVTYLSRASDLLFLSMIMLCGILGSHLPKNIKDWNIIQVVKRERTE